MVLCYTGPKGDIGAQGPKGDIGPIGKQGDRGQQGSPGKDGKDAPYTNSSYYNYFDQVTPLTVFYFQCF